MTLSPPTSDGPTSALPSGSGQQVVVGIPKRPQRGGSAREASRLLRQNTISDVYDLGLQVDQLLASGLNDTTKKLNRELIAELRASFDHWLIVTRKELLAQVKKVPAHARERWLRERLENSGLSIQWFSDLGIVEAKPEQGDDPAEPTKCRKETEATRSPPRDERRQDQQGLRLLVDFLLHHSRILVTKLVRLKSGNRDFRRNLSSANSQAEREQVILRYSQQLGASRRDLRGDQAAFRRWFDEEAVNDRFLRQLGHNELILSFLMERLGIVLETMFTLVQTRNPSYEDLAGLWDRLGIEDRVFAVWNHDGDPRIHASALRCLGRVLQALPIDCRKNILSRRFLAELKRAAFKSNLDVWVQCRALDVLIELQPGDAASLLVRRLNRVHGGDDLFVRRYVLKRLEIRMREGLHRDLTLPPAENEPSEFVRQQFARTAYFSDSLSDRRKWHQLALEDSARQVRAAALLVASEAPVDLAMQFDALECIVESIRTDPDPFVVRVGLHSLCQILWNAHRKSDPRDCEQVDEFFRQRVVPAIESLAANAESIPIRRVAAQTRERIWAAQDSAARELLEQIGDQIREIPIGKTRRFRKSLFQGMSDRKLGRVLAIVAIDDFGIDVHRQPWGVYLTRGPVFGLRLWRCYFEATHTATDKRQALRHTVGRINASRLRVTSQICGELSETKVPGEPLMIANDGTWRPFLPLLDDLISLLNQSWFTQQSVQLVSTQGVTRLTAPRSVTGRLLAAIRLNLRFADYAKHRNWDDDTFPPNTYVESLRELGFVIQFENHASERSGCDDDSITRFFAERGDTRKENFARRFRGWFDRRRRRRQDPQETRSDSEQSAKNSQCRIREEDRGEASLMFCLLGDSTINQSQLRETLADWLQRFRDYFAAAFENTLEHLLLFTAAVTAIVVIKHFWSNVQLRSARAKIPLSIGGWGTRGKSGTERLKAALVGSMGHGLVSKTTGCEAMFIHADPFSDPLEIPLFRPFDKATIWEQSNLLRTVARLKPSVFLWECMALTPSYVDVLQRQWTRDDLATITNTYPDHEDLQGPAGHNVATTIAGFVPERSHLICTEEQMRPYVSESCRERETSFHGVGWLESGLVTDDVLERFPYKEHPDNVALVAALGEELGVEPEVAVKAMGDYLVPDLGVLKTHPIATVRTRKIEFTNGMSANERFGCMGNWKRLGFDRQDPWNDPTTWVSGVVNNRADRVPRSKVFAKILVEDLNADRFFLIGNNLEGLRGFIEDAWDEHARSIKLRDASHGNRWDRKHAFDTLRESAKRYRQVIDHKQLHKRLSTCIHAAARRSGADGTSILSTLEKSLDRVDSLKQQMIDGGISIPMASSIASHHDQWLASISEYARIEQRIRDGNESDVSRIEEEYATVLRTWFFRKLVTLPDYDATGEEVVSLVVDETPPGFTNRVIGLQNIKGTGLDFVYRFQDWDACHQACIAAMSAQISIAARGLETLVAMPTIGQLCEETMWSVVRQTRQSKALLRPDLQAMVQTLEQRLKRLAASDGSMDPTDRGDEESVADPKESKGDDRLTVRSKWNEWFIRYSEEFLDLTDSLKRRQKADQVYQDLANGRIGRQRAISVLRSINKRQKGGWLAK